VKWRVRRGAGAVSIPQEPRGHTGSIAGEIRDFRPCNRADGTVDPLRKAIHRHPSRKWRTPWSWRASPGCRSSRACRNGRRSTWPRRPLLGGRRARFQAAPRERLDPGTAGAVAVPGGAGPAGPSGAAAVRCGRGAPGAARVCRRGPGRPRPFVHMDQMGEVNYARGEPKGTPWHPHRASRPSPTCSTAFSATRTPMAVAG
jgi:hypothetical protein